MSPPGSAGGGTDHKVERCDSDSVFPDGQHSAQPHAARADGHASQDCSVHLNINVNAKAVSNNSSTGKSSGVSSVDGVHRVTHHQDGAAVQFGRAGSDGGNKSGGDDAGDNNRQTEDDGSFSIRQKLHSLVDDVFAFVYNTVSEHV